MASAASRDRVHLNVGFGMFTVVTMVMTLCMTASCAPVPAPVHVDVPMHVDAVIGSSSATSDSAMAKCQSWKLSGKAAGAPGDLKSNCEELLRAHVRSQSLSFEFKPRGADGGEKTVGAVGEGVAKASGEIDIVVENSKNTDGNNDDLKTNDEVAHASAKNDDDDEEGDDDDDDESDGENSATASDEDEDDEDEGDDPNRP